VKDVLETPNGQRNFLEVTTFEMKIGFLLIEVFRKLFNPKKTMATRIYSFVAVLL